MVRLAAQQHCVVAAWQLARLGLTRKAIRVRVENGRLYRQQPHVYSLLPELTPRGRMMAALLTCGRGAALSHRAAGAIWDICPWPAGVVDVSVPRNVRPRHGLRIHRVTEITAVVRDGFRVTAAMRTLADVAAIEPRPFVERAYESAVRHRLVDVELLAAECEGRRGSRTLKRLMADGREAPPGASELERRFRAVCARAGLPLPSQNVWLHGFEVDAYWPQARLVVELDGYEWHSTRKAFEADRHRDAALARAGIRVLRFTWRQLTRDARGVAATVRAAYQKEAESSVPSASSSSIVLV